MNVKAGGLLSIIALQIYRIYDVLYGDPDRPRHTNSRRSWSKVF